MNTIKRKSLKNSKIIFHLFYRSSGKLEPELIPQAGPKILSSIGFRDAIVDEWKRRLDELSLGSNDLGSLREGVVNMPDTIATPDNSQERALPTNNSKFAGNYNNPFDLIRRTPDYASILEYLGDMRFDSHVKYDGPSNRCQDQNLEPDTKREQEILLKCSKIYEEYNERTKQFMEEEKAELLKKIGAPWSWLHSFASQNSNDKTYNFIELNNKLKSFYHSDDQESEQEIEKEQKPNEKTVDKEKLETVESIIREILANFCEAEEDGIVTVSENESILSYMTQFSNYETSEDKHKIIDFGPLKKYIEEAEVAGLKFNDLDELHNYFIERCAADNIPSNTLRYKIFGEKIDYDSKPVETVVEPLEIVSEPVEIIKEVTQVAKKVESKPTVENATAEPKIEKIFLDSGIEVDQRVLTKQISNNMILGLATEPECLNPTPDTCDDETLKHETESELSTDLNPSKTTIFSDSSSKVSKQSSDVEIKKKRPKMVIIFFGILKSVRNNYFTFVLF